jgi:hypothetical protein
MELSESVLNSLIASRKGDLEELQQSEMRRDEVYYLLFGQHQGFIQALELLTDLIKKEEL